MWLFTTFGFFSVVAHRDCPKSLMIRARVRTDLEGFLFAAAPSIALLREPTPEIIETPRADYPFRIVVSRFTFGAILAEYIDNMHYANFKNEIHRVQGSERAENYHDVWEVLHDLDPRHGRNALKPPRIPDFPLEEEEKCSDKI